MPSKWSIAGKAGVDPFDVSLPLLVEYLPAWHNVDFIALVADRSQDAGFIRPSRRIRSKPHLWILIPICQLHPICASSVSPVMHVVAVNLPIPLDLVGTDGK